METISSKGIVMLAVALVILFVAPILLWRKARSSILWRFLFCLFVALIFTPIGFNNGHSSGVTGPAIFYILGGLNGGNLGAILQLFKMFSLPIILFSSVLFGIWSTILYARKKQ